MATKSVLKTVHIKDNTSALHLANALENAHGKQKDAVVFKCKVSDATSEDIKAMFGEDG